MNDANVIGGLVIGLIVIFGLFLIFRELFCWYWKINKLIKIQQALLEITLKIYEQKGGEVKWDHPVVKDLIGK